MAKRALCRADVLKLTDFGSATTEVLRPAELTHQQKVAAEERLQAVSRPPRLAPHSGPGSFGTRGRAR
jgi:hypothetical protein